MKDVLGVVHWTAFSQGDADAHVDRLVGELHQVRVGAFASLTLRGAAGSLLLRPSWLKGELLRAPPHTLEMQHSVSQRHGRWYCETRIGVAGTGPAQSETDELLPETQRSSPDSKKH